MNEELKKLFEGAEGFKPEFLTQLTAVFESKVEESKLAAVVEAEQKFDAELLAIKEAHTQEIATLEESFTVNMETKLNAFLNAAVLEWANENAPVIDGQLKVESAEKLLAGLAHLFAETQLQVTGDAEGVIAELQLKLESETQARTQVESQLHEIRESQNEAARLAVFATVTEGLADTQKETITNLLEGVPFKDAPSYTARVQRYRNLIEGKKPTDGDEGKDKDPDGKDKDPKKTDKDEANKEVNESIQAQIAATLARNKPVNG
ncbi:prohead assembly (scaffolding) protein [Erwinia phage vB_EamM-Bue1]|uniref:Prohead assembly (Scaffolding) protein n=1 Tax=Erwinia phage vB_EamM-Bue1 TaxID=2099338 RepID=A0A2P1JUD7_9CAUD|nr:prohead assembly (scaffolding) protein [Erwinia phage vB_EamM-Bue1]AVO22968.1 prohead assembly (scaffolding) protein [Erwinia phage vB_EamM-Bue1]